MRYINYLTLIIGISVKTLGVNYSYEFKNNLTSPGIQFFYDYDKNVNPQVLYPVGDICLNGSPHARQ